MTRSLANIVPAIIPASWLLLTLVVASHPPVAAEEPRALSNSTEYFPDTVGNRWQYKGQVIKNPLQKIARETFENVSTVTGTERIQGVEVTVFHDTNSGSYGPQDSYYRRDAAGVVYYGSKPGTTLERQVVPYQVVIFPLTVPSSFHQFDRTNLDFGTDLDGDGVSETTDLAATVTVIGEEPVSVPAGTYEDALRIEAHLRIRIHLSKSRRIAEGQDTMTAWFARGIGLVKYIERQELPGPGTRPGRSTEISEELVAVHVVGKPTSGGGRESPPEGVLADNPRRHELEKVIIPAGFGPHP